MRQQQQGGRRNCDTEPASPAAVQAATTPYNASSNRLSPFAHLAEQPLYNSSHTGTDTAASMQHLHSPAHAAGLFDTAVAAPQVQQLAASKRGAYNPKNMSPAQMLSTRQIDQPAPAITTANAVGSQPAVNAGPAHVATLLPLMVPSGPADTVTTPGQPAQVAAKAANAAAINVSITSSNMASPARLEHHHLPQLLMASQYQAREQQDRLPVQHQQQASGAGSSTFRQALLAVMLRAVLQEEVNDLRDDIAVLTQFDIAQVNKSRRGPQGNSSKFRGVTRHRRTQRWEAHIWDSKKQVYLGGFDNEVAAAKAHDVMAIKTRGERTLINFKVSVYKEVLPFLNDVKLSKEDVIHAMRETSKHMQRLHSTLRSPRSTARGIDLHDPHSVVATAAAATLMAAAAAAGTAASSPRTPTTGKGGTLFSEAADSDAEQEDEDAAAQTVLRKAARLTGRGCKSRAALAAAAVVAAAATVTDEDSQGFASELAELLAEQRDRAARGRQVPADKGSSSSHSRLPLQSTTRHAAPVPRSSPTLPGLGSSPLGASFVRLPLGRFMPSTAGLDCEQTAYGSPAGAALAGLRPLGMLSPQGLRFPGLMHDPYTLGFTELSNQGMNLTVDPLDLTMDHQGLVPLSGTYPDAKGAPRFDHLDLHPTAPAAGHSGSTWSQLTARQLISAAAAKLEDANTPQAQNLHTSQQQQQLPPPQQQHQQHQQSAARLLTDNRLDPTINRHDLAHSDLLSGPPGPAVGRSLSFELEQQLAQIPPLHLQAGSHGMVTPGNNIAALRQQQRQQQLQQQQQQQVPYTSLLSSPPGNMANVAAQYKAGVTHTDVQRVPAISSKQFAAATPSQTNAQQPAVGNMTHSHYRPEMQLSSAQVVFNHTGAAAAQRQVTTPTGTTPFSFYNSRSHTQGNRSTSASAGDAGKQGEDMLAPSDETLLIPNMHVGIQVLPASAAVVSDISFGQQLPPASPQQVAPAVSGWHAQGVDTCTFSNALEAQQQQKHYSGLSWRAAAEAAAVFAGPLRGGPGHMRSSSNAGAGASASAGAAPHESASMCMNIDGEDAMGCVSGVGRKRTFDGNLLDMGPPTAPAPTFTATAADAPPMKFSRLAHSNTALTLPGIPVGGPGLAGQAAWHPTAAAPALNPVIESQFDGFSTVDMDNAEEQAALEAAASAAAAKAEAGLYTNLLGGSVARRFTWPSSSAVVGHLPHGSSHEDGTTSTAAGDAGVDLSHLSHAPPQLFKPGLSPGKAPHTPAAAPGAGCSPLQLLQQQQQQQHSRLKPPNLDLDVLVAGKSSRFSRAAFFQPSRRLTAPACAVPHSMSPGQATAMQEAAALAEMAAAAASAAVVSAEAQNRSAASTIFARSAAAVPQTPCAVDSMGHLLMNAHTLHMALPQQTGMQPLLQQGQVLQSGMETAACVHTSVCMASPPGHIPVPQPLGHTPHTQLHPTYANTGAAQELHPATGLGVSNVLALPAADVLVGQAALAAAPADTGCAAADAATPNAGVITQMPCNAADWGLQSNGHQSTGTPPVTLPQLPPLGTCANPTFGAEHTHKQGSSPAPAPHTVTRQYSSKAASSFSMPSEGTAAAASALAGLAGCVVQLHGTKHASSPASSQHDRHDQQQQPQGLGTITESVLDLPKINLPENLQTLGAAAPCMLAQQLPSAEDPFLQNCTEAGGNSVEEGLAPFLAATGAVAAPTPAAAAAATAELLLQPSAGEQFQEEALCDKIAADTSGARYGTIMADQYYDAVVEDTSGAGKPAGAVCDHSTMHLPDVGAAALAPPVEHAQADQSLVTASAAVPSEAAGTPSVPAAVGSGAVTAAAGGAGQKTSTPAARSRLQQEEAAELSSDPTGLALSPAASGTSWLPAAALLPSRRLAD